LLKFHRRPILFARLLQVIALLCALTGSASAQQISVTAFGDSITKGWPYQVYELNGNRGGPYPGELERLIREKNPGIDVIVRNWGMGGETTYQGIGRLHGILANTRPQWVVIFTGTNDLWSGVSAHSTAANIGQMIDLARLYGATPVVTTLLPSTYTGHPGHLIPSWYNPAIMQVAIGRNVPVTDLYEIYAPHWAVISKDGLHPNYAGYLTLGRTVCDVLAICSGSIFRSGNESDSPSDASPMSWIHVLLDD